jgi:hypothetical protein
MVSSYDSPEAWALGYTDYARLARVSKQYDLCRFIRVRDHIVGLLNS